MLTDEVAARCLAEAWGLSSARLTRLDGGMGSRTWIVGDSGRRWVLKAVTPEAGAQMAGGLVVAQRLERAGIPAGRPEPTEADDLTVTAGGCRLGLLAWVPGEPLTGADEGQRRLLGTTLGRVHRALSGQEVPLTQRFHWVDPATGRCGVIDWSAALHGPLLYDLASAVMYLGGPRRAAGMVDAYLAVGTVRRALVAEGLDLMLRFRWAVQADYFARRITGNDLTGITGPEENEKGLEDARRALCGI